jgi:hypothetical protein
MNTKALQTLRALLIILVILGLVLGVILVLKNTYFSFKSMASRGIEACQKLSGTSVTIQSGTKPIQIPISHPYCKINIWGKAEFINPLDEIALRNIKAGDLLVRVVSLNNYFKDGNPLIMEMDAEVANNSKIMAAIMNSDNIGGDGKFFKLKKPTGYTSICGELNLPNLNEKNFLVTPIGQIERSYGFNQTAFCSKIFDTEKMPFMGIAFIQPSQANMTMKLYIPPEENQGVNVPVDEFMTYHDSFLPFDRANLIINP